MTFWAMGLSCHAVVASILKIRHESKMLRVYATPSSTNMVYCHILRNWPMSNLPDYSMTQGYSPFAVRMPSNL
jgi:hypothetical protein